MNPNNPTPDDYPTHPESRPESNPKSNPESSPESHPGGRVEERRSQQGDVWRGIGLALLLHLIQIPFAFVSSFLSLIFVGVSQLAYLLPAILHYRGLGRRGV